MADLEEKDMKLLQEIFTDAETTTRLSDWETNFIDDMRGRFLQYGASIRISDKQWATIKKIEERMYA